MLAGADLANTVQELLEQPVEAGAAGASHGTPMHQVVPKLWIGGVQNAHDERALRRVGVTHICTSCERDVVQYTESFKYVKIAVRDPLDGGAEPGSSNIARYFWKTNAFIQEAIDGGGAVLVHCTQGVSSSAACAIAFLMQSARLSYAAALAAVRVVRPFVRPAPGFVSQLR